MQLTPLARYDAPAYPTCKILYAHPELLRLTPRRWQGNAVLLGVLGAVCGLSAPALAQDASPQECTAVLLSINEENKATTVTMGITVGTPQEQDLLPQLLLTPETSVLEAPPLIKEPLRGMIPPLARIRIVESVVAPSPIRMIEFVVSPPMIISRGVVTIPVRPLADYFNMGIQADGPTVTLSRSGTVITLTEGSACAVINGKHAIMPTPARLRQGTLYAPARFLVDALGGKVVWQSSGLLTIMAPDSDHNLRFSIHSNAQVFRALKKRSNRQPHAAASPTLRDTRRAAVRDYLHWLRGQGIV
ncbi:MAG: copper amine oxidase N-terminal domain-containing protein [Armatimonadota bacterium]